MRGVTLDAEIERARLTVEAAEFGGPLTLAWRVREKIASFAEFSPSSPLIEPR